MYLTLDEILELAGQTWPQRKFQTGQRQIINLVEGKVEQLEEGFYFVEQLNMSYEAPIQASFDQLPYVSLHDSVNDIITNYGCGTYEMTSAAGTTDNTPYVKGAIYLPNLFVNIVSIVPQSALGSSWVCAVRLWNLRT